MRVSQLCNKVLKVSEGWSKLYAGELADGLVLLTASFRSGQLLRDS